MELNHIQIVLISTISLLVFLIIFFLVRNMLSYRRKREEQETRERTQVTFVVDTFHDLMAKLKEKEKELEALRNRAEQRASSVELYNENIIQSVPSGVVSIDQELRITRMNEAALHMLDLKGDEVIGRQCAEIFQTPLREMISRRTTAQREETAYTTGSGKRLWIGLALSPLRDSAHAVIGQLLVFTDLTELKAFQSQNELRDRLATLGEMSAGIAHELRNPMGVISGYTRILSKKVDDSLKPAVSAIAKEIEVMNRIITEFLTFARPSEPALGDVDLAGLFHECIGMIGTEDSPVSFADSSCLPVIRADEVMMRQAISNLLLNAGEAMPDGGKITVSCQLNEHLRITITDTGHGIPENIREKIFLPFYTTKERGTGLGLALVHKIIVSHGGTIRAESSPQGTSFIINLPKAIVVKRAS